MFFYTFIMPMKPKYKIDDWSVNNKSFAYSVGTEYAKSRAQRALRAWRA